jgi:hypothetical protein
MRVNGYSLFVLPMISPAWRFVIVAAFAFWQGGFTFYAAVVVPIGTRVLGSPMLQGEITREVTVYLNLAGGIALVLLAADNIVAHDPATWRWRLRWLAWLGMAISLGVLVWLHPRMLELLDAHLLDQFRGHHRWYLWISTLQWGFGIMYLVLTLWGWRYR